MNQPTPTPTATRTRRGPRWAQVASDIFSPILVPTIAMAMAMWLTPLRSVPEGSRLFATLIIAAVTALVPLGTIMMLMKVGKVSDTAISDIRERLVPYSVTVVCYCAAAWILDRMGAPWWLTMFYCGAAVATAIALVITLAWKISAHSTAMGGLVGMFYWITAHGVADISAMIWLSGVILVAGLVGTARLFLDRHTLLQVVAGLALGIGCCYGFMSIH